MIKILMVAHDPGGAVVLNSVKKLLPSSYNVNFIAHESSASLVESSAKILAKITQEQALEYMQSLMPDLLIISTSWNSDTIDKKFTIAARIVGIPSIAIMDSWSKYRERFTLTNSGSGELIYLPDCVAVMDNTAAKEMIENGIDKEKIEVIGHPTYSLYDKCKKHKNNGNNINILYISQPISEMFVEQSEGHYPGYTEIDVANILKNSLNSLATEFHISLYVRYHPKERINSKKMIWDDAKFQVDEIQCKNLEDFVCDMDIVIGITSTPLVMAYIKGVKVISIQPTETLKNTFYLTKNHYVYPVTDSGTLDTEIKRLLKACDFPRLDKLLSKNAIQKNLINLIQKHAKLPT